MQQIPNAGNDEKRVRLRMRLAQVHIAAVTLAVTAWCVTLGPLTAIIALLVAKHILVALLMAVLDGNRAEETPPPDLPDEPPDDPPTEPWFDPESQFLLVPGRVDRPRPAALPQPAAQPAATG